MRLVSWLDPLSARQPRKSRGRLVRRSVRWHPAEVELLEDRTLLTPYAAIGVPLQIPPLGSGGYAYSQLYVSDDFVVQDVNVQLNIEHANDSNLDVYLVSPDTYTELFFGVGGSGANFTEATLDQQATVSIADAAAPFTGSFRPTGDLSAFNGLHSQGYWYLVIYNFDEANEGTLLSWSLTLDQPDAGGTLDTAMPASAPITTGTIGTPSDVDLYSIELPVGIAVTAHLEPGTGSDLNGYLRVFDASGILVASSDAVVGDNSVSVTFTPRVKGRYFVGVSSVGNEAYDPISGVSSEGSSTGSFSLRFFSDASRDLTELTSADWQTFAGDNASASVSDDQTHVLEGNASLKFVTRSGFDTGITLSSPDAPFDLSHFDTLSFFAFADNPNPFGFQGNQPVVELDTVGGGRIRLAPNQLLMRNHAWQKFQIPLAGDDVWQRTADGIPDLSAVTDIKIHLDTWDYSFAVYFDGMKFSNKNESDAEAAPSRTVIPTADPVAPNQLQFQPTVPGEYTLQVDGTGTLTLLLSMTDQTEFAGSIDLMTADRRLLREQIFGSSPSDGSATFTEHIGPGSYLVRVVPRDSASLERLSIQPEFNPTSDLRFPIPVGAFPKSVLTAQLNNDDFADVVTANQFSNDVSVLLSRGDGTFEPEQRFSVGVEPVMVQAADVDGDGHLDLITVNEGSNDASVLLWRNGTYMALPSIPVGSGPVAFQAVDIDGDPEHHLDLVVANRFSNDVSVLLGNGDGTFQTQRRFAVGNGPNSVQVLKANRDQLPDLVTSNELSGNISLLLGTGGGTFEPARQFLLSGDPTSVQVVDVNGDHLPDLIAPNYVRQAGDIFSAYNKEYYFNGVSLLLGTGDGRGFDHERFIYSQGIFGPTAIQAVNITGDKNPDLVVANGLGRSVSVFPGLGSGDIGFDDEFAVGSFPTDIKVLDLNGDGLLDVVTSNEFSNDISVLLGQPDGSLGTEQRYRVGASPQAVQIIDVNGDDRLDLVTPNLGQYNFDTGNYSDGSVSVLLGNGDGTFRDQRSLSIGDSGIGYIPEPESQAMTVADVNNDGHPDLVVPNGFHSEHDITNPRTGEKKQAGRPSTISVLLGRGDGSFEAQRQFVVGDYPSAVRALDVNSDGRLDLITHNLASNDSSLLLGRGDGTFEPKQRIPSVDFTDPLPPVDVNGDDLPDVVTPNFLTDEVNVQLADAQGNHVNALSVAPVSVGTRPVIADLNGDGIDDVLVLRQDGAVLYRQGVSPLEFGTAVVINPGRPARDFTLLRSPSTTPIPIVSGPLQSNAAQSLKPLTKFQIATVDRSGNTVGLYELVNSASLTTPSFERTGGVTLSGSLPARIVSGNFDHDPEGRDDFAIINQGTQTVTLYLATANGFVEGKTSFDTGAGPVSLTAADLNPNDNHDNPTDLLVSNFGSIGLRCGYWSKRVVLGTCRVHRSESRWQ